MFDRDQQQTDALDTDPAKKRYASPVLREYGNMEELTRGTGLVLLDLLVQGSIQLTATVL
jgi:hypothetical protein